jgi:(1->4)-alpha-D-glucan 1-alpha-D-glucosylmutase
VTARANPRRPASTYRLQIHAGFDLFEASRRLPYLHDLGVDWVYLSPLLAAEPGSTHGYDVVAFDHVDESRGGAEGLAVLSAEARRLGMGVLVDLVPNHMGVATPVENAWWWDVLKHGPTSVHAGAFDIDWDFGLGKVRLPVLGDDDVPLDGGPIGSLTIADGELRYHDHRFPLAPGTIWSGDPDEHDVTAVHSRQHYELISWRRGDDELNYRRFFTVTDLAGVRVELPEVFISSHVEVRRWFDEGLVDGLRIDHPDGLRDPGGYLDDLSELTGGAYVLVEKILETGEGLPRSWATAGTTGYDVLALLDRVLTDPAGQAPLDALETRLRGTAVDWQEMVHDLKRAAATGSLNAETRRIVRELPDLLPHTTELLEDAVAEVLACFAVYRSYLPEGQDHLDEALDRARSQRPDLGEVLDAVGPVLGDAESPAALRFQQTSGMVMAKGVEDCAFYRSARLTSLNEVGADPNVFAIAPEDLHTAMAERQRDWPDAMTTLTTHDTKRGEDTRARITALAEAPGVWEEALDSLLSAAPVPDPGFGNLLWQAAYGAWPISRDRLHAYAEKAMREAGDHTTWTDPGEGYEKAVHAAVDAVFDEEPVRAVLENLDARFSDAGRSNALAAKLLSITVPGVPDVYQGSEVEQRSLVDPDNRRPVDFDAAAASLATGSVDKQRVTGIALRLRRGRPELFTGYTPLTAEGPAADHVLAFDRGGAITVVTRLPVGLEAKGGWGDTTVELPEGQWRSVIGGFDKLNHRGGVRIQDLLGELPVALLVRED